MKYNEDDREWLREHEQHEREEANLRNIAKDTRRSMRAAQRKGYATDLQAAREEPPCRK